MAFDLNGALAAGASHAQIAEFLAQRHNFDLDGARAAGATDDQIASFLADYRPTPTERTWGEAAADKAALFGMGAGGAISGAAEAIRAADGAVPFAGALGALAAPVVNRAKRALGIRDVELQAADTLSELGKETTQYWEGAQSDWRKAKTAAGQARVQEAAEEGGQIAGGWQAAKEAWGDPERLIQQIPNLAIMAALGRLGGGTAGAIGGGAVLQGGDVASGTREALSRLSMADFRENSAEFQRLVRGGLSEEDARARVIDEKAQQAFGASAALSVAANTLIPGGASLEKALAGQALGVTSMKELGAAVLKGALGEAVSEGVEEGGGQALSNVAVRQVDPTQSLSEGVGAAAGEGAATGLVLGGGSNAVSGVGGAIAARGVDATTDMAFPEAGIDAAAHAAASGIAPQPMGPDPAVQRAQQLAIEKEALRQQADDAQAALAKAESVSDAVQAFAAATEATSTALDLGTQETEAVAAHKAQAMQTERAQQDAIDPLDAEILALEREAAVLDLPAMAEGLDVQQRDTGTVEVRGEKARDFVQAAAPGAPMSTRADGSVLVSARFGEQVLGAFTAAKQATAYQATPGPVPAAAQTDGHPVRHGAFGPIFTEYRGDSRERTAQTAVAEEAGERPSPMPMSNGKPFASEKAAASSARQRKLDMRPVPVEGGWGLVPNAQREGAAPDGSQTPVAPASEPPQIDRALSLESGRQAPRFSRRKKSGDAEYLAAVDGTQGADRHAIEDGPLSEAKRAEVDAQYKATERAYGGRAGYERAKAAGRTKLNYRQWVQVRTPAFKQWFGDWEAAENARVLQGDPVAILVGGSAPQTGMADVRKWAASMFKAHGGVASNPAIGEVLLDERAVRDSMGHGRPSRIKYEAFAAVADVIESGALVLSEHRGRDGESHYISAPVRIAGVDDIVTVLVRRDVNTQRMYLHSVATKESLLNRRGSGADAIEGVERSGSSSAGGVANVLQSLLRFNFDTVSKVTDPETGEPMGMHHGTSADFSAFDTGGNIQRSRGSRTQLRDGTVATLTGAELGEFGSDVRALRKAAIRWYQENLQHGEPARHPTLGEVRFTKKGRDEVERFSADPDKLKLVPALRQIVELGEFVRTEPLDHARADGIVAFHIIAADVSLDGVEMRAQVDVAEDAFGRLFYDLFPNAVEHAKKKAARGTPGRQNPSSGAAGGDVSASLSASIPDDGLNIKIIGRDDAAPAVTRDTVRDAVAERLPSLAGAVDRMLARGDEGKRGGLVLVESASMDAIAEAYASKTGRSIEDARGALQMSRASGSQPGLQAGTVDALARQWEARGITVDMSVHGDVVQLNRIVVPDGRRGEGLGTAAMQELVDLADRLGKHVALTPTSDFGGNKGRLRAFYKRFGFVENKGRNRAFSTSHSMYRQAQGKVLYSDNGDIQGFFDPQSGLTFLVAPNLTAESVPAVLLHEATHGRQRADIDARALALIDGRASAARPVRDFLDRVAARMEDAGETGNAEEATAYIVEEAVLAGRQAGFSAVDGPLMDWVARKFGKRVADIVRDFAAMVRSFGLRIGVPLNPSVDDLVAIARGNVRAMARGDVAGQAGESRSAMKDIDANIQRGLDALAKAVTERTSVHRAMFRNGLGWVDFVWGSEGAVKTSGKTKGAMGIAHILEARQRKDGMDGAQVDALLSDIVTAIARGGEVRRDETALSKTVVVEHRGVEAILTKRAGSNAWLLSGWAVTPGASGAGSVAAAATPLTPTTAQRQGAGVTGNVPSDIATDKPKFSRASAAPAASKPRAVFSTPTFPAGPIQQRLDQKQYEFQDRFVDLKRIQQSIVESGRTIRDEFNPYMAETLMHGKAAYRVQNFLEREIEPMLALMRKGQISIDDLNQYLHARHAAERNAEMMRRNPNQAELDDLIQAAEEAVLDAELALSQNPNDGWLLRELESARSKLKSLQQANPWSGTEADRRRLSGMSDAEAKAILDRAHGGAKATAYRKLGEAIDRITAQTRDEMAAYGLESAATVAAMDAAYQHYVPLHRDLDESDLLDSMGGTGRGFSIRGSQVKQATGSLREVENIFANIVAQREATIVRGEKNRVAKALYGLVMEHPNSDLYNVVRPGMPEAKLRAELAAMGLDEGTIDNLAAAPRKPYLNPKTGLVEHRVSPAYLNLGNAVVLRVNGEDRVILFNRHSDTAMRLVRALRNDDSDYHGASKMMMDAFGPVTRYISAINTQYNPIFGLKNFVRDVQGAALNLESTELAGQQAALMKAIPTALKAVGSAVRGKGRHQWAPLYEEFLADGGATGFRDQYASMEARAKAIERDLSQTGFRNAKGAKQVLDVLSDYNTIIENATRFAAYKIARDAGLSRAKAADLAKDITVNFNRKGARTGVAASLYAFFNASVQGAERTFRVLKSPRGRKIIAGGLALGVMQAVVGILALGDDWDEIPEHIRSRNIIIPVPWTKKKYIAIPMPLGWNAIPNLSRTLVEMVYFRDRLGDRTLNLLATTIDAVNPLGSTSLLSALAPSAVDPLVEMARNENFAGRSIEREDFSSLAPTPGWTRAKEETDSLFKGLSYALNWLTSGGKEYEVGLVSPTPELLSYAFGTVTGGVGREIGRVVSFAELVARGDEVPAYKIPVLGGFYGEAGGSTAVRSKYYSAIKAINEAEFARKKTREAGGDGSEYADAANLARMSRRIQSRISDLNKDRRLESDRAIRAELEAEVLNLQQQLAESYQQVLDGK